MKTPNNVLTLRKVHEFGHALMTKKLGGSVGGIVLWPLGGFALCGPAESLKGDLHVALAGPLTHLPMGFLWWAIYVASGEGERGMWPSSLPYLDVMSANAAGCVRFLCCDSFLLYARPSFCSMRFGSHAESVSYRARRRFFEILSAQAVYLNILLFCFNLLLPAYPVSSSCCINFVAHAKKRLR